MASARPFGASALQFGACSTLFSDLISSQAVVFKYGRALRAGQIKRSEPGSKVSTKLLASKNRTDVRSSQHGLLFKEVAIDFETRKITRIVPHEDFVPLFHFHPFLFRQADGSYRVDLPDAVILAASEEVAD